MFEALLSSGWIQRVAENRPVRDHGAAPTSFDSHTGTTITDSDRLLTQLKEVKRQGYAVGRGRVDGDLVCGRPCPVPGPDHRHAGPSR
ncbi:MAG: IclR family transcriptional regulator C-terminal domain-containing protein [Chloroflexi bacterium]|nr:IclR family transcriptional regulator C-terminal domain-containing protein [Chloroflexota bacterium]